MKADPIHIAERYPGVPRFAREPGREQSLPAGNPPGADQVRAVPLGPQRNSAKVGRRRAAEAGAHRSHLPNPAPAGKLRGDLGPQACAFRIQALEAQGLKRRLNGVCPARDLAWNLGPAFGRIAMSRQIDRKRSDLVGCGLAGMFGQVIGAGRLDLRQAHKALAATGQRRAIQVGAQDVELSRRDQRRGAQPRQPFVDAEVERRLIRCPVGIAHSQAMCDPSHFGVKVGR